MKVFLFLGAVIICQITSAQETHASYTFLGFSSDLKYVHVYAMLAIYSNCQRHPYHYNTDCELAHLACSHCEPSEELEE